MIAPFDLVIRQADIAVTTDQYDLPVNWATYRFQLIAKFQACRDS